MINLKDLKLKIAKKSPKQKKKDGDEKYKGYPFHTSPDDSGEVNSSESAGLDVEAKKGRCWEGYEPTPGKKPYSPGSCQKKKEKSSIESEAKQKKNPWAICHTTVDKDKDPDKYERCVQDVKKSSSVNLRTLKKSK